MMRGPILNVLGPVLVCLAGAAAASAADDAAANCALALERSRALLEDGPLLKEELATAVMWMRLDAEKSRDAGDHEACVRSAGSAQSLLQSHRGGDLDNRAN